MEIVSQGVLRNPSDLEQKIALSKALKIYKNEAQASKLSLESLKDKLLDYAYGGARKTNKRIQNYNRQLRKITIIENDTEVKITPSEAIRRHMKAILSKKAFYQNRVTYLESFNQVKHLSLALYSRGKGYKALEAVFRGEITAVNAYLEAGHIHTTKSVYKKVNKRHKN